MKRLAFFAVVLFSAVQLANGLTLYVSPQGDDGWSGRSAQANGVGTDGPFASLGGARDAIRKLKTSGPLIEPVRVVVGGGFYNLSEPFTLTAQDSGTADCPITYEASGDAVFSAGRRLEQLRQGAGGLWQIHIPEVASGEWYFQQLWVNGRRAVRARTPNKFYHYMQNVRQAELEEGQGWAGANMRQTVTDRR